VSFSSKEDQLHVIPSRDELFDACGELWYQSPDYSVFKVEALNEMKAYMRFYDINCINDAMELMYQPKQGCK
jgi:hypothetical protein